MYSTDLKFTFDGDKVQGQTAESRKSTPVVRPCLSQLSGSGAHVCVFFFFFLNPEFVFRSGVQRGTQRRSRKVSKRYDCTGMGNKDMR